MVIARRKTVAYKGSSAPRKLAELMKEKGLASGILRRGEENTLVRFAIDGKSLR